MTQGALSGVRVVELGGVGPVPFVGMVLADHGAEVVRVDRPGESGGDGMPTIGGPLRRGKRAVSLDLKNPDGVQIARTLIEQADVLLEGFRPGVAERLGLGPDALLQDNPRLVYARITGWGQDGEYALMPGHDINYVAITGVLNAIGRRGERPVAPALFGDYAAGGMVGAFGIVASLFERERSGRGQVIDVAVVDAVAQSSAVIHGERAAGTWLEQRGANVIDTGAPFYEVYETADGKYVAVGAGEPKFYAALLRGLGLGDADDLPDQLDRDAWPALKERFAAIFRTRTRDEWCGQMFADVEACVTPVLSFDEAIRDAHLRGRESFVGGDGYVEPAPAPRFTRTPAVRLREPARAGEHTEAVLAELGYDATEIGRLQAAGVIGPRS